MGRKQLIAVAVSVVALLLLFFFAETSDPSIPDAEISGEVGHSDSHNHNEIQFSLDDYKSRVFADLDPFLIKEIQFWEDEMRSLDDSIRLSAIDSLIFIYSEQNIPVLRAKMFMERAEMSALFRDWSIAGDIFLQLLVIPDLPPDILRYFYSNAVFAYQEALNIQPEDERTELKLAKTYVSMDGMEVMNGVQLLLSMLERDSNNVDAYLLLAENGLRSGQFDKAEGRINSAMNCAEFEPGQVYGIGEVGTILAGINFDQGAVASSDSLLNHLYDFALEQRALATSDSMVTACDLLIIGVSRAYLDRTDQSVMNGIQILLAEVDSRPDNFSAQLELIRQGIRSQQFENAVSRLEIVVSLQTVNSESYLETADLTLQLVDYFYSQANKEEALRLLELLKTISNDSEKATLDQAIVDIKNS